VGLNRRGFSLERIHTIQDVYRQLYNTGLNVSQAVAQIEATMEPTPDRDMILGFIKNSPRGIIRG
jgi:UDP-N-acetylglucosamine acyltransferase